MLGGAALVGGLAVAPEITAPIAVAGAAASAGSTANLLTTPTPVEHAGSLGGNTGMLGVQSAYIILSRPNVAIPSTIRHDQGLKSCISSKIGNLSGYVKMKDVHVDGLQCTDTEKAEIERLLKTGIIC